MTEQTLPPGSSAVHDPYNEIVLPEQPDAQTVNHYPAWLAYGGPAWNSEVGKMVELPARVYPVVDLQDDNYGRGIIIRNGLDFVIDGIDIGFGSSLGYPNGERIAL